MKFEEGAEQLLTALKGIHGNFKKLYGQAAIRLDSSSYIMTNGNALLSDVSRDSFVLCDIRAGGLGMILDARQDINAVIIGISPDMAAVSEAGGTVRTALEDLAQLTGAELRIADDASPDSILSALGDTSVCLIKGVGGVAAGSNARKAVAGIQIVEKACEAEVHGRLIGGTTPLDPELAAAYREEFRTDYVNRNEQGKVPFIGFEEDEFSLRSQLIDYGKDLVRKDLSYGSWGNLSVRIGEDEMLITPSSMDYFDIRPEDIVRLNINTLVYGDQRIPSSESVMHAVIYRQHDDVNAIIHTHANGISVFSACEAGFTANNPDVRKLIGNVMVTEYARPGSPELAAAVSETMKHTHAAIIPHHGAVFTGPSLDIAFRIAEAVDIRARNLLGFDRKPAAEEE